MPFLDRVTSSISSAYQWVARGGLRSVPDGAVIVDPASAYRWTIEYTPARLAQIKARRSLPEILRLCEVMLEDDKIRSLSQLRGQALMGATLEWVEGKGRKKKAALRAVEAESDAAEMIGEAEWLQVFMWGVLANFGTARKRWWEPVRSTGGARQYVPRRRNGRIVPALEFWHPCNFRLDPAGEQWWARARSPGEMVAIERPIAWDDGEFCAFCPWGGEPGLAADRGLWIAASLLWLLKQHVIASGASLGQRMGTPIKVIEFALGEGINHDLPGGAGDKREQLVKEILKLQREGVVSLPPGFTMRLLSMPPTSVQMFAQQWVACDDALTILWSGNNLTTSIKGGSLAAANVGQEMFAFVRRFDASQESSFIHHSVMTYWATINFSDAEAAPWPERDVDPPEDLKAKAATWFSASQAYSTFEKAGLILDKEAYAKAFELPAVKGQPNTEPAATPAPLPIPPPVQVPNAP